MNNKSFYTVLRAPNGTSLPEKGSVIALGTFDGVHSAHKSIISEAIALKERIGACSVGAWCFSELPSSVLGKADASMLCTLDEKVEILLSLGLDFVAVGDFKEILSLTANEFVEALLKGELGAVGAVCGFNHRFGKGGLGSPKMLEDIFGENNVKIVPEIKLFGETVSSSAIREHIAKGEVELAAKMLERPVSLTATVKQGKHLGHVLGFPTANMCFKEGVVTPKRGIYASLCYTEDGKRYIGVSNVGIRPSITDGSDSHAVNCETYICDFDKNIYGQILRVEFYHYLREEKKFDSLRDLRRQIAADALRTNDYFASEGAEFLTQVTL